jgi:hypothetical protein
MKHFRIGGLWLAFSSVLAVSLLVATPAKATTLQPRTGVYVSVEVFKLDGSPIVDDVGVTGAPIECWEPVKVVVTVDVDETAELPIQVMSFPGSPEPDKHPSSPWMRYILAPRTLMGEYWTMWRCDSGSSTVKIGAVTIIRYGQDGENSINSGNTQVFSVTAAAP